MWRALHSVVAVVWLLFTGMMLSEIVRTGNVHFTAHEAGTFDASFVLFMLSLMAGTAASSVRALWAATDPSNRP